MNYKDAWTKLETAKKGAIQATFQTNNDKRNLNIKLRGECFGKGMTRGFIRNYENHKLGKSTMEMSNPTMEILQFQTEMKHLDVKIEKYIKEN